jgi:prepilin-type N-terminal cleavage/methylation domain-containing protein
MLLSNKNQMKNASKLNSNLPPLSLPLKGGEATSSINLPLSGGEQKRGLYDYNYKSAFTLVELSIVIVVLGILVSGVVGAQNIIDSAKRSAFISKISDIQLAANAYKLEFDAVPGDHDEAWEYFGSDCQNWSQISPSIIACNGDGNRKVENSNGEGRKFWDQLNASEIYQVIPKYDSNINKSRVYFELDFNGRAAITPHICAFPTTATCGYFPPPTYRPQRNKHSLYLGSYIIGSENQAGGISPADLSKIDSKMDDGKQFKGIVLGRTSSDYDEGSNTQGCATDGEYIKDNTDNDACNALFIMNF